jgi:Zn-dependent metalloprotease
MPEVSRSRRPAACLAVAIGAWLVGPEAFAREGGRGGADQAIERLRTDSGGTVRIERSPSGLARFVTLPGGLPIRLAAAQAPSPSARAMAFLGLYGQAFGLGATPELRLLRTQPLDGTRTEHVRFQQTSHGLPVAGAQLVVHLRGDAVTAVNGRTLDDTELAGVSSTPTLSADRALAAARGLMAKAVAGPTELASPRLEILNRGLLEGRSAPSRLAWFISARAQRVFELIWVDAASGEVLLHFNQQPDARQRVIYDAANGTALPGALARSEGQAAAGDADVDAAYELAGDTYDYFWTCFGRDSIDGAGQPLVLSVRYGQDFQNAFWDSSLEQIALGAGAARVDDVVAHEITHGLTQHTANLYYYWQAGALNESFSDIFGEMVDLSNGTGNDTPEARWLVGEDWTGMGPLRNMMTPAAMGSPGKLSAPELWCSGADNGGVHLNSGILNHAFALAVDGGSYNGQTIAGMGVEKAAAIAYRALTVYLTPTSAFADADSAFRHSCQDLVGVDDVQVSDCEDLGRALDAVELTREWPCFGTVAVTKTGTATGTVASDPQAISCGSTCEARLPAAFSISLTATPDPGAVFTGWSGWCNGVGACSIGVERDGEHAVTAGFDLPGTLHPVSVAVSGTGTVSSSPAGVGCGADCGEEFPAGSMVTLTAVAPPGWALQAWGGDCSGRAPCTLTMNGPKNVTASFAPSSFLGVTALSGLSQGQASWGDYDGDGDLDLVVSGSSWPPSDYAATRIYRNDGGTFTDTGIPLVQVRGFVAWGDYDNDGDLDLLVGGATSWNASNVVQLYRNDSGTFTPVATPFVALDSFPTAAWGDYDNDGDLDLVICGRDSASGEGVTKLYRNDHGTFVDSGQVLTGVSSGDLAWGDYDNDGDLDLVVMGISGSRPVTVLYRNDGGTLVDSHAILPGLFYGSASWADYDGDGDLDLTLNGESPTVPWLVTRVLRNDAGVLNDSGLELMGVYYGAARWGDSDGDGDLDLLVHGRFFSGGDYHGSTRLYRNDGATFQRVFSGLPDLYLSTVAWGDYDKDGRLDVLAVGVDDTAGRVPAVGVFRNTASAANAPPQPPADPVATIDSRGARLEWNPGTDAETPRAALSYNLRVGTTAGGSQVISAMADAATGYRRVAAAGNAGENTSFTLKNLPPGQYYWAVQTIDASFAGSAFSETASFVVPRPVVWTSAVGVEVSDSTLTKTGATGWGDAGAISTQVIGPAGGYVEFTASETTTDRVLGLSNGNTGSSWEDIDFALCLCGGQIKVYEAGSLKGTFGSYGTGDRMRVGVTAGVVSYSRNGSVFYTSTRAPVFSLLVDCALYDQNATLASVVIWATPTPAPSRTEAVVWTGLVGVTASGNSLTKKATTGWGNAGAISTQTIAPGDGSVEFTASETTTYRMLGLSNGNASSSYTDVDFALYLAAGQIQVYEAGSLMGSFGSYATGDKMRVAVTAGIVSYSRNGTVFYTLTGTPSYPLLVDSALYSQNATLSAVLISMPAAAPSVGQAVVWTSLAGVTVTGNSVKKTAATGWGNAGAISTQAIASGDGYVEFTASETTTYRMLGLSNGNANSSYTDVDFALYLAAGEVQVYEAGSAMGTFGGYATGDKMRVAVTGGVVRYSRNGTVFFTSTKTPVYPLLVDSALYSQNATLASVVISGATMPPPAVAWTSLVGVTAIGSTLKKTAATGWGNAGAVSTQAIPSGDGSVEFTASETTTYRMLGLSNGNTDSSYTDVDFRLYLAAGQIQVYEAGTAMGTFGSYATGDKMKVAVTGGVVRYSRNGTVFYTSAKTPVYPLLVDSALYSQNATLSAAVIAGAQ